MNELKMICAAAAMLAVVGCASTSEKSSASAKAYPLKTCIVTDDELDKDSPSFVHNGQEVKICCDGCKEDFDKEPDKYLKKLAGK